RAGSRHASTTRRRKSSKAFSSEFARPTASTRYWASTRDPSPIAAALSAAELGAGMGTVVDSLQVLDTHAGVDLSGAQLGVAEDLLDQADVGAVLEHQRGHRMTKDMAGASFVDAGLLDVAAHDPGQAGEGHRLAATT